MSDVIGTAKIVAELDSSGVEVGAAKGKRSLADLGATAKTSGKQASDSIAGIGKGGDQAAQKVDAATRNMIGSIQRQIAAMEAGTKSGSEYYKVLAGQRGIDTAALKPYLDQLDATAAKQVKTGISAGQMSAALRGVPAQFTDIATSIAAGQSPLTVFLQQGGQLKDMFGGAGPAAKALGGYILGLVNPYTAAAGAVAALGYAFYEGSKQSKEFADALAKTGDYAGKTEGQFNDLVKQTSAGSTATVGAARELAQALIGTGQISSQTFNSAATAAASYAQITGKTAQDVAKDFAKMASEPAKFAVEINQSMNLITAKQYEAIKAFEENGRAADAQGIIYDALNQRAARLESGLGSIEKALISGKKAWSEYWDKAFNIGREETTEEKLAKLDRQIENAKKLTSSGGRASLGMTKEQQDEFLNAGSIQKRSALLKQIFREQENAYAESLKDEINKQAIAASSVVDGYLKRAKSVDEYKKKLDELNRSFRSKEMAGTPVSDADKKLALDQLKKDFTNKSAINTSLQIDKAKLDFDIDTIQKANDQLVTSYTNAEKNIDALHSARLISDSQYYEAKRQFINVETRAEEDALQKQIARYQQEKLTGKDKIDNDKKIVDAESKLAILRANASAKQSLNSIAEVAANTKIQRSYEDARQAAKAYLDTIARQNTADIAGIGKGTEFRTNQAGRNQIENKFTTQRQGLERDKRNGNIDQDQFDTYLSIAQDTYQKELQAFDERNKAIKDKQSEWLTGADEAFANYKSNAENVAAQSAQAFTNAFDGLTNGVSSSIADAIVMGKSLEDSLKNVALNVADAFISSFIKVQIQKLLIDKTAASAYTAAIGAQSSAMVAMAGLNAFASTAAIPIVGPILAPEAAAAATLAAGAFATAATIAAGAGAVASARGGYDIPAGVNPITQLHEQEMVLPKAQANVIRDMASGGKSGSGAVTIINQTSAKIGKVTERRLDNGERALILEEAVEAVAAQMGDPNSKVSRSMGRNFNVPRSR